MFKLEKEFKFEASHQLLGHDGKCARKHGHSWKGRLVVEGRSLQTSGPKENMLVDYGDMGTAAKVIEELLDHRDLNDVVHAKMPTSEFVARWVFDKVRPLLSMDNATLMAVVIEETCTSRCEYRE